MTVSIEDIADYIDEIKEKRRKGEFEPALVLAKKIRETLYHNFSEEYSLRSTVEYEVGFVHNILGDYGNSISAFRNSALLAGKSGDKLRETIGEFRTVLTSYLSGEESAESAFEKFYLIHKKYSGMTVSELDKSLLDGSIYNTHKRICDTAFEVRSDQLEFWHESYLKRFDKDELGARETIIKDSMLARINSYRGNSKESINYFLKYMQFDEPRIISHWNSKVDSSIISLYQNDIEERARDYRDLGRELAKCNYPENSIMAKYVWREGLEIDSGRGNKRFLADIERELEKLS